MTSAVVVGPSGVVDPLWDERLAALSLTAGAAVADDPTRCADEELTQLVVGLEVVARQLVAAQSALVAEASRRGMPGRAGTKDGAGWLRSLVNLTPAQARLRAEVGQALLGSSRPGESRDEDLTPVRDALMVGTITAEHAKVVLDAADQLSPPAAPPNALAPGVRAQALGFLVEHGSASNAYQLKTTSARLVAELDPEGDARLAQDEDRQAAQRGLTLSRAGTGLVHLRGTLTLDCAGLLATAIDAGSAPRAAADGTPDDRSAAMRRHDSLRTLLHQVIAADGVLPSTHGTPYRLVITVPHDTLKGAVTGDGRAGAAPGTLADGWPVSSVTAATLACTAELVPVVVDDAGNPLDVGHTQYVFPTRIRTAITTRDRHYTWPGCTAPSPWCDTHHFTPYTAGGATSVSNGALLCGRHHRHVHTLALTGQLRNGTVHWNLIPGPRAAAAGTTNTITDRLVSHLDHRNFTRAGPEVTTGASTTKAER